MILSHTPESSLISDIINKRKQGWPLDKILGQKGFYKHDFFVDENVLSPRPDTELLVEKAIGIIHHRHESPTHTQTILELGVGSGCVLLSILKDCPNASGVGIDISEKALKVANKNKDLLGVDKVTFLQKDWFKDEINGLYDMIVSNPPYIPNEDIKSLDREVKDYDPMLALDGGIDGLDSYKKIAEIAPNLLKDNGYILLEVGINQSKDVADIFIAQQFNLVEIAKDLSGIERCIILQKTICK